ncbi:hypothetical protein ACLBWZ_04460 [Brucellaceae bacterium C25G]
MKLAVKIRLQSLITSLRLKALALTERNWREQTTAKQEGRED